jgi:hypothetical protein
MTVILGGLSRGPAFVKAAQERAEVAVQAEYSRRLERAVARLDDDYSARYVLNSISAPVDRTPLLEAAAAALHKEQEIGFWFATRDLLPRVNRRDPEALTDYFERLAAQHETRIVWRHRSAFPPGTAAFADVSRREVHASNLEHGHDADIASVPHELAHVLNGPCGRRPGHFPNGHAGLEARGFHQCLQCEMDAWLLAIELVPAALRPIVRADMRTTLAFTATRMPGTAANFKQLAWMTGGSR